MARYTWSLGLMLCALVALLVFHIDSNEIRADDGSLISTTWGMSPIDPIDWVVISVFSAFALLSVWGLIGVALSKLREKSKELAMREAVISKRSWHYRLNTWVNLDTEPKNNIGECEYWARLFHGLCGTPCIWAIVVAILGFVTLVVWLVGARVSNPIAYIKSQEDAENKVLFLSGGKQPFGPLVLVLLGAGSLASILLLSDAWQLLLQAPWENIGKWTGMIIGSIAGGIVSLIVVFLIGRWIWHSILQPFLSYANALAVGLCRKTRFVE